jgi:hypothetical protein
MPPERKADIQIFDYPVQGRSLIVDVTCVGPFTSSHGLNHTPDGESMKAARIAETRKEVAYRMPIVCCLGFDKPHFLALALDVFGVWFPVALLMSFFDSWRAIALTQRSGFTEGPQFSKRYSVILHIKWRTRLSVI